ncbi:MAG: aspartate aminotransferase family protein [Chlamydiota bacterium]|nr:aspartate aminotransferase family protein [Chlamydiota bacterium]
MKIGAKTRKIMSLYDRHVMGTYRKTPVVFTRAKGSYIWDIEGKKYFDFFPGWGVSGLGHCHPTLVKALKEQSEKLLHVTNNYYNAYQGLLAKNISDASFDGKCFFTNSGAEAIEGAIKLARSYGSRDKRYKIIAMKDSFHGRTMGAVTATGQPKYHEGFFPLLPGFKHIAFNDTMAFKNAMGDDVCAVLLEIVQGEGGVHVIKKEFYQDIAKTCREKDILLIVDEVQTGMGRTGKMFAFQHYGIEPDVMTLAKALGGGIAIGAFIANRKYADVLKPASHATTFGGNPLATRAGVTVFDVIKKEKLVHNTVLMGRILKDELLQLKEDFSFVKEVRGLGLMQGIEVAIDGLEFVRECFEEGLLLNIAAGGKVIRFMPALNITADQIHHAMRIVRKLMKKK